MKHFYPQGLPMTDPELLEANRNAYSQELIIYYFMQRSALELTAWDLKNHFPQYEVTSLRRSLFNLEKQGKIVQRGFCPGPKGKPVGKYIAFTGKLF